MPVNLLVGMCSTCKRKKSLIVTDQTIQADGLGNFFVHLAKQQNMLKRKF